MNDAIYLSRSMDYLGDIGAKLRDLQGYRTLAHELIQNADDATSATSMCFDVRDDALVVDNDGIFSDCQQVEAPECPWKTDGVHDHRCDFHRFRQIGSGDKRGEAGTTGAFGIGFIAIYQITDAPELISAGRHWILHEEKPENQRIEACPGCPKCAQPDLPGTRFILPWSRDPDSELRRALKAEEVSPDGPQRMSHELEHSLPVAMLFLKRLRTIEIKHAERAHLRLQRLDESDSLILSDGTPENDRVWLKVHGDFSATGAELRLKHLGRIEKKRSTTTTLAIPAHAFTAGLLCACLPTEQDVGLPFHVNADFFPTNDRKRIIFAEDYQSEWNREALRACSRALGQAIDRLPALLGRHRFWELVATLRAVSESAEQSRCEATLAEFWTHVAPRLRTAAVVPTTKGEWTTVDRACLLLQKDEAIAVELLEAIGVEVVHEDLRPHQRLLRSDVGIPVLDVDRICDALAACGLNRRTPLSDLPAGLDTASGRDALWTEVALLLERQQRTHKARADDERRLREIALAPGRDGALWPCGRIYVADDATVALFESLDMEIPFLANEDAFASLSNLCLPFDAGAAIEAMHHGEANKWDSLWKSNRLPLQKLLEWFENKRQEILADPSLKIKLARLPLFPSAGKLLPLDRLALPGNFTDPLGLAELVDLAAIGGRREFLRDLDVPELDFPTYVASRLPAALADDRVPWEKRRASVLLLASHIGEMKDDEEARSSLAASAVVECTDKSFRPARDCHFDNASVRECLGDGAHFVVLPKGHEAAVRDLYAWLGVADEPRLSSLANRIRDLTSKPYSSVVVQDIQRIFAHLGKRVGGEETFPALAPLRSYRWLPARGKADRWYAANELYAVYQDYLFATQAVFLDVPASVQNASRPLLVLLGVHLTPAANLVVKHLLCCVTRQIPVNVEVYRFLNDKVGESVLGQLKGKESLWLGDAYYAPWQVFWGEHPFGRYRRRLGDELRAYGSLLKHLEVRDTPTCQDGLRVISEIASEFGAHNRPLDDEAYAVLMTCWRIVGKALDESAVAEAMIADLCSVKCVPDPGRILNLPKWMFFENRAGLSAKFGELLARNVIPKPLDAGNALTVAGVRTLGTAVTVELLECHDPADDRELGERIRARRNEIGRVLDARASGHGTIDVLNRLEGISCQAATSIKIRYRLNVFNQDRLSPIEQVPALYRFEDDTLLFTRRDGNVPWSAIAREIAVALYPEEDPGQFAAGLKEALAPDSPAEAAANLDELGFARLDTTIADAIPISATDGALGIAGPADGDVPPAVSSNPGPDRVAQLTPEEALRQLLGEHAAPPTPPIREESAEPAATGVGSGASKSSGASKNQSRPVLRSYLPAPGGEDTEPDGDNDGDGESRSAVDEAGIRRVLESELASGRAPKEMPHKNPGYDVESRDAGGRVVRYIEVKSLSGQWRNSYAVLSRSQFRKGQELGDLFWLYVVERALDRDFQICRIQNPALKANRFMFDDGWRVMVEPAPKSEGK